MNDRTFQRSQYALAGMATVFSFVVYIMTVAPTFSYWDCGEFIACAHILGIPHPPGTPLFVLLGRIFSILPTATDIALRINYLSVISSAMAAGVAVIVLTRMIRAGLQMPGRDFEQWQGLVALFGGLSGALFMAFSSTHWNNAVETEVYGPSMLVILLFCWMAILWADRREEPRANRYLIGIGYAGILSLGLHMTAFMAMPAIFLFLIAVDKPLRTDWRFWVTGFILFSVAADLKIFLFGAGLWLIISVSMAVGARKTAKWGVIAAIMVAGWLGYTSQLYLPIRSVHDPWIDENDPETFESFQNFLERKQYGQTSMIKRMFTRRGKLSNQFGDHANMGFYHYFKEQYGVGGWMMLPVIIIGFYGVFWLLRRRLPWGMLLFTLFLLGSVGLIMYMNFADGTMYSPQMPDAYMEVRNRDYFFTPGFIIFGMMLGLGFAAIAGRIGESSTGGRRAAVGVAIIAALLPIYSMASNWRGADRSGNYTPYDYAWNLLQSCDPNAILFTSGDNDTFPVWCLQEAYGVRKDVSVVNLSLAQTDWYIYQMKHKWGLPISFTDDQILWTVPDPQLGGLSRPKEPYDDPVGQSRHFLFAYRDQNGEYVSINKMIVENIVINNNWKRPIYFSSNPADKSRLPLGERSLSVGQAHKLVRDASNAGQDWDKTAELLDSVFLLRSYQDPTIGLDDNAVGLSVAYPEKMIGLANHYRSVADTANWEKWSRTVKETFPFYHRAHESWANYLTATGDTTGAAEARLQGLDTVRTFAEEMPTTRLYWYFLGKMYDMNGDTARAEEMIARAFWKNPNEGVLYNEYVSILTREGKLQEAARAADRWLEYNKNDQRALRVKAAARQAEAGN